MNWIVMFYNNRYRIINEFVLSNMTEKQAEEEVRRQIQLFREHVEDWTMEEVNTVKDDSIR